MSHQHPGDQRLRVLTAVAVSVMIALTESLPALWAILVIAGLACAVAVGLGELSSRSIFRRLVRMNAFVAVVWLTVPWAWQGDGWAATPDRIELATLVSLRLNAIAALSLALLATVDAMQFARAASALGVSQRLSQLLALTVHFVGLFSTIHVRLERAARARGYRRRWGLRSLRVSAQWVAALWIQALVQGERRERGLRARGFFDGLGRTSVSWTALPREQWLWSSLTTLAVVLALVGGTGST